jgi:hypothetical protein
MVVATVESVAYFFRECKVSTFYQNPCKVGRKIKFFLETASRVDIFATNIWLFHGKVVFLQAESVKT